jgi:glycosyltransferase involved in cell wall biosynthesis
MILVDDGSTDGSSSLCDEYASRYEHIRCHHQANSGHTAARQQGFQLSHAEYVTFVDSDDWVSPDMYTCMCKAAAETNADILLCNYIAAMPDSEKKSSCSFAPGLYDRQRLLTEVYPYMIYSGTFFVYGIVPNVWNKIFRRSLLEKHLMRVPRSVVAGEDGLASYSCMLEASSMYFFDEAFYYYRSTTDSITHTMQEKRLTENHTLFDTYDNIIDLKQYPYMEKQLDYFFVYHSLLTFVSVFGQQAKEKQNFRQAFLSECAEKHIHKAFSAVRISDINGMHNKFYAFCIRHGLYLPFKLLLNR